MPSFQVTCLLTLAGLIIGWLSSKLTVFFPNRLITTYEQECKAFMAQPKPLIKAHAHLIPWITLACLYAVLMPYHVYGMTLKGTTAAMLALMLVNLSAIDIHSKLLPDSLVYSTLWLGLFFNTQGLWGSTAASVLGALLGYLAPWLIIALFKLIYQDKELLGYGDCKMFAMMGAWMGPVLLPRLFIVSIVLGGLYQLLNLRTSKHQDGLLPFGPCIALSGLIALQLTPPVFYSIGKGFIHI